MYLVELQSGFGLYVSTKQEFNLIPKTNVLNIELNSCLVETYKSNYFFFSAVFIRRFGVTYKCSHIKTVKKFTRK